MINKAIAVAAVASALAQAALAQPSITAVLNAASYDAAVSPGSWIAIFGNSLAAGPMSAPPDSLPMSLDGVSIKVGDIPARLSYVSPKQVNALIPIDVVIPADTVAALVLTSSASSITYNLRLTRNAPGIFTRSGDGTGRALVFDASFHQIDTIAPGDTVMFYATGLGPDDASGDPIDDFEVYLGDRKAQVLSAFEEGIPGVYQVYVKAPRLATDRLYLRSGGWQSNITHIGIAAGANTAGVSGAMDGLYPSSDPMFNLPMCMGDDEGGPPCSSGETFSVMLHAGSFSVSFTILPSAGPFDVAAVGEAGGTIISIDPAAGTYTASVSTLTSDVKVAHLQDWFVPVWDYISCNPAAVCAPFPGPAAIPPGILPPLWIRATQVLPAPNVTGPGPVAYLQSSGAISGSRFVIDDQNNSGLARFGGVIQVPFGPFEKHVSRFQLYVDGKLVASRDFSYMVAHR